MNDPASSAPPEYLEAWSLRCHPFEKQLDSQFFYAGSALMQRLDLLTHMIQFGESIVLVSGPSGSGKSCLLEQFLGHINTQWVVCLVDGALGDRLSDRLGEALGGAPGDDEQTLLKHWAAQNESSQHIVIIIDNAEQLDESVCQRLCALTGLPDSERLRIVLFGAADTEQRIRTALEQIASKRTCQILEVPKLTEEETASYLLYRLAVAGYSGESPFTPTEVRAIRKAADGRPGEINRLAHQALTEHHLRVKNKKRAPVRRASKKVTAPLWIGATLALAAVTAYLGWQRFSPTIEPDSSAMPSEPELAELPLERPTTPRPVPAPDNRTPAPTDAPSPPEQITETPTDATESASVVLPREPSAGNELIAAAPIATNKPDLNSATKSEKSAALVKATVPAAEPVESPRATAKDTTTTTSENSDEVMPSAQPLPAAEAGQPHREDWLLQQPPGSYTLQMLGSREQSSMTAHIKRNTLEPAKTAYYRGRYRGGDWYVLLYGIYPDKAAALTARSTLSDRLQKTRPWPRSLKSVQNSIREVQ